MAFNESKIGAFAGPALSVIGLVVAWLNPETWIAVVFGWIAAIGISIALSTSKKGYLSFYLGAVVTHIFAFHWLFSTIKDFGGFPSIAAGGVFLFFCAISALQFPIALFIKRRLPSFFNKAALAIPVAWILAEFIAVRIFPWNLGHTQLKFTLFAQVAAIVGDWTIGFLMVWLAAAIIKGAVEGARYRYVLAPLIVILISFGYGGYQISYIRSISGPLQKVALIQGDVSIEDKHNMKLLVTNRNRYEDLTLQTLGENVLIVWPESVIQEFIPTRIGSALHDERVPYWQGSFSSLLIGGLTAESRTRYFNSALAVFRDGTVPLPYHKRILMPYGEYTPFGDLFPFIKEINATAADFTPGEKTVVFEYPLDGAGEERLKVAPLICYEDIVPNLSREAARNGAEVLASLSNDAWFGRSIAPRQHHIIAAFRAIETKRYLLRATNSGLTAIVNPLGETTGELPSFSEGVLRGEVIPLSVQTPVMWLGDSVRWILLIFSVLCIALRAPFRWLAARV